MKPAPPPPESTPGLAAGSSSLGATRAVGPRLLPRSASEAPPSRVGEMIGRYLVLTVLGSGAMGVVYQVYDPQLDRQVALKLLLNRGGPPRPAAQTRLHREAMALAKLNHENVVTVYDVGDHGGQIYVAMEFVSGQTLSEWLGVEGGRSWREVLPVFIAAGRGLAAAHREGLIHRDFKPDNVMIDEDGRVRVMDFGLARRGEGSPETSETSTDAGASSQRSVSASNSGALDVVLTRTGSTMGTPAYMAPEQFRGRAVTALSDQFGFCVALYEALFGARPFCGEEYETLARAVQTGQLQQPPARSGVPPWLTRAVLAGLATEPSARHTNMDVLLAELSSGETRRRRKWLLAGGLGLALSVGAGLAWQTWDRERRSEACEAAGEAIASSWNAQTRAELRAGLEGTGLAYAAATAERVDGWLDRQAVAWREQATAACTLETIDERWDATTAARARWCLEDRRVELDALRSVLTAADASQLPAAVTAAAGLSSVETCVDPGILAQMRDPPPPDQWPALAAARRQLFEANHHSLFTHYDLAEQRAKDVAATAETLEWPPLIAAAALTQAKIAEGRGQFDEAETLAFTAYEEAARVEAWDLASEAATSLAQLTGVHGADPERGELWLSLSALASHHHGETGGVREARRLSIRAALSYGQAKFPEAQGLFEQSRALLEDTFGPEHPDLSKLLNNLGVVAYHQMRYDEAVAYYERAVALDLDLFGPEHPHSAIAQTNLANVFVYRGQWAEAKALYEAAALIQAAALGTEHPQYGQTLNNLGNCLLTLADFEGARETYARAVEIREAAYGPDHPDVAWSLVGLGEALRKAGQPDAARPHYERALAIREAHLEPHDKYLGEAMVLYGIDLLDLGELDAGIAELERGLAIVDNDEVEPYLRGIAKFGLARGLWRTSEDEADRARARELARAAREQWDSTEGVPPDEREQLRTWIDARD